jgi:ABC-type multidrug transport system ATPase subunit
VSSSAISIERVSKLFPQTMTGWRTLLEPFCEASTRALNDLSLEVREGEAVALLGTNGAGKSTLMRILATLLVPSEGSARVAGQDTVRQAATVRKSIGYHAGTDHGLYPRLSGRENLLFFGELNRLNRKTAAERIDRFGERFGLADSLGKQVRTLSSGTIQRISLLRALLHQPPVLLLDEPTRSLDVIAAAEFRAFLKAEVLAGGRTTTLFASHTLPEVELLASRVAILDRGQLLACDTVSALKRKSGASTLEQAFFRITGRESRPAVEASVQ